MGRSGELHKALHAFGDFSCRTALTFSAPSVRHRRRSSRACNFRSWHMACNVRQYLQHCTD